MTQPCPICRSPVDVDDSRLTPEGVKVTCGLCDETFVVRSQGGASSSPAPSTPSGGKTSATPSNPSAASASRRLLEEDAEGAAPRVLVAHDSHAFGDLVRGLLEEEGFDVEVVHDGEAAQKVIADRPPLVAILEAGLPKKFGFQLCADLRAQPDPPSVRFLLVASIYDRKRFAKNPELAGAPDDFVEPRNLEIELLPKVRRLLRGRSDATGSRPAVTAARRVEAPPPAVSASAIDERAGGERGAGARREAEGRPSAIDERAGGERGAGARREAEGRPSAIARPADPPTVSRPTVDQDDFKDLFEDSDSGAPAVPARADPPAPSFELRDVDDVLRTGTGPAVEASESRNTSSDEEDLLRGMLDDSDSFDAKGKVPEKQPEAEPDTQADADEESGDRSESDRDDDELLRTLMQMASSEGVEPSKPTLEDDEVLPEGSEEMKAAKHVEPDEDSLLGGILEDGDGMGIPRDAPRDEPTGRAPADGPMELPSIGRSVPEVWRTDEEDAKLAAKADPDELSKLLGDGDSVPGKAPAEEPKKSGSGPKSEPESRPMSVSDLGDDPVLRVSEFELDGPPPKPAEKPEPKSNGNGSSGAPSAGFELDGDGELEAALEDAGVKESLGGVLPGAGSTSGTPTVLKGPAGRPAKGAETAEEPLAVDAPPAAGGSFSSTESIGGDDDEKSLAEAKVPREMDDELDRLLGGGSQSASAAAPKEPENVATKPGMGPRPLPADELAPTGRGAAKAAGPNTEHEKAKRLAKLIVGDILLYNAERIADAVKTGTFFEVMKGDIKDGRDFYDEKVPEDIRRERDYIQETLEEVLDRKRKELGLA